MNAMTLRTSSSSSSSMAGAMSASMGSSMRGGGKVSSADPPAAGRWQRPLRRQFPDFRHLCSHPALFAALSCQNVSLPAWLPSKLYSLRSTREALTPGEQPTRQQDACPRARRVMKRTCFEVAGVTCLATSARAVPRESCAK